MGVEECQTCSSLEMAGFTRDEFPPEWEQYRNSPKCPGVYKGITNQYYVYVIELDKAAYPDADKPCVYVGQSANCPYVRAIQHKIGRHKRVTDAETNGVRLLYSLYKNRGPYSTELQSKTAESAVAAKLRKRGYIVLGGH